MVFYYKLQEIQNYSPDRALTVIGIEEKVLTEKELQEQGKVELYKDCITYEGDIPFLAYPILEGNTIRPATRVELIGLGLQSLDKGEYIEDNEIIQVSQPNEYAVWNEEQHIWTTDVNILPEGYILKEDGSIEYIPCTEKYVIEKWNREKFVWEEGATEYEKLYDSYSQYLVLNNPRDFNKMEVAGVLEDYNTYLDECEKTFETYTETISEKSSPFPQPSEKLKNYFNNRKEKSNKRYENITNSSGGGQYLSKIKTLNAPAKRSVLSNTPISMNTLNTEISKLLGKAATTPISMSGLQSMLDELKANMKKVTLINLAEYSGPNSQSSIKIDVSNKHLINNNTTIIGYFKAIDKTYNKYTSDFGIILPTKGNFSVTTQMNFSAGKTYPATLSKNGNELYASVQNYGFNFLSGSSYLILADDL